MSWTILLGPAAALVLLGIFLALAWRGYSSPTRGAAIADYGEVRPALLVIDIQEGLSGSLARSSDYRAQSEPFLAAVNGVIDRAQALSMPIIYIHHEVTNGLVNFLSRGVMAAGSPRVALDQRLKVASDHDFAKHRLDGFSNPDLGRFLEQNRINRLYLIGLDAAFCVDRTSRGGLNRGYQVRVIQEAVITGKPAKMPGLLDKYRTAGIEVISDQDWWTH